MADVEKVVLVVKPVKEIQKFITHPKLTVNMLYDFPQNGKISDLYNKCSGFIAKAVISTEVKSHSCMLKCN